MKKVSVIIPVYNTEKYLEKCLKSVIEQTFKDIEIIIINDGSTDNSEKIIKKYLNQYPEIIKYYKQENQGIACTRNNAINYSNGEYFIFLDSDDYLKLDLIENLTHYTEQTPDIVKYKLIYANEEDNKIEEVNGPIFDATTGQEAFNQLCFSDILIDTPCLYLFNTKFYKENNFKFIPNTYHEDFGLIPLILLKAESVISTEIFGYYYVQRNNSIVRNDDYKKTLKRVYDLLIHYDNMEKTIESYNITEKTKENVKLYYTNCILSNINKLKKEDKKRYIREIKKRKLLKNIKIKNVKTFLKRIYCFSKI